MKFSVTALLAIPALTSAFAPAQNGRHSSSQLGMAATATAPVVTGPKGRAASSREEDMALTLQIILDHEARSATVSTDQLLSQTEEIAAFEEQVEEIEIDISIPYDAPAALAYASSDKSMEYAAFRAKYEADALELVKSKQPIDISIPYDAAAKLAYEASDKSMPYADFKTQYEADAVAMIISKQPKKAAAPAKASAPADASDVSIDYDAAARLAYKSSDKSVSFADFKPLYEADAIALVVSKKPVDIGVNYMAAVQLAFLNSDRSVPYADFEKKYLADAVELVKSKIK